MKMLRPLTPEQLAADACRAGQETGSRVGGAGAGAWNRTQAFRDAGVGFVIIGGLSAVLHGSVQVSYDLDSGQEVSLPDCHLFDGVTLRNSTVLTLQTDIGEIEAEDE
jgi:hypothetical protein